ncbi:hypothetical protein IAQ61_005768, partial [Plenodomus lingam]|uniref:uncharacterized protein n=1 Tax=Leptosphaeria maculans TaxID=5022 RepID=UPI00332CC2C5
PIQTPSNRHPSSKVPQHTCTLGTFGAVSPHPVKPIITTTSLVLPFPPSLRHMQANAVGPTTHRKQPLISRTRYASPNGNAIHDASREWDRWRGLLKEKARRSEEESGATYTYTYTHTQTAGSQPLRATRGKCLVNIFYENGMAGEWLRLLHGRLCGTRRVREQPLAGRGAQQREPDEECRRFWASLPGRWKFSERDPFGRWAGVALRVSVFGPKGNVSVLSRRLANCYFQALSLVAMASPDQRMRTFAFRLNMSVSPGPAQGSSRQLSAANGRYRMLVQNAENDGWGCLRYWLGRRDAALRRRRPEKPCAQINYCSRSLSVHCQLFSVEPLSHPSGLLLRSVSSRRTVDAGIAQNHMWPGDAIAFNLVFVFVFSRGAAARQEWNTDMMLKIRNGRVQYADMGRHEKR